MNPGADLKNNEALEIEDLRQRLAEAEELIDAIRKGHVDALAVFGPHGDRVYTLEGADHTYRLLIETISEGAVTLSEEGVILYCNRRFADMTGRSSETVMGSPMADLIAAEESRKFDSLRCRALTEDVRAESLLAAKNKKPAPVLLSMRSLLMEDARAICVVVTDLTDQKVSEQKIRLRSEQLRQLALKLSHTEDRERRKIAAVLHDDLQQYLAAARFHLQLLIGAAGEKRKERILKLQELIDSSIQKCRTLSYELSPPVLSQKGFLAAMEWLAGDMRQKHGLTVLLRTEPRAEPADPALAYFLFCSVRELLFNVVKHSGCLSARLELHRVGDDVELSVRDQGQGFDRDHIGESESGFGLFNLEERLKFLGGRTVIESAPGNGCCVKLYFPIKEVQKKENIAERLPEAPQSAESRRGSRNMRVIVADDHAVIRDGLINLLHNQNDFEIVGQAADGREVVRAAKELNPDIILMDVSMPEMNGIEATAEIHKDLPNIRIIGLSMHDNPETTQEMMDAGATAYVHKASPANKLIEIIRSVQP